MRPVIALLLLASGAFGAATPPGARLVAHERRDLSTGWSARARAPRDATVPVHIALTQSNLDAGSSALMEISDPTSPQYSNYWTAEEVQRAFAPSPATINHVKEWLIAAGIATDRIHATNSLGGLKFDATVQELEQLTNAEYHVYEHEDLGRSLGCDGYHLPVHMQEHIDFITPGVGLAPSMPKGRQEQSIGKRDKSCPSNGPETDGFQPVAGIPKSFSIDNCSEGVFPQCINELYNIPNEPPCPSSSSVGIFSSIVTYLQDDLDVFFKHFTKIPAGSKPDVHFVNEAKMSTTFSGNLEADLDVENVWPLIYPQKVEFYAITPSLVQFEELKNTPNFSLANLDDASVLVYTAVDDLLQAFDKSYCNATAKTDCGTLEIPKVMSLSITPEELAISEASAHRLCNEIMKLSLQGTTVIASSGDWGVAQLGSTSNICYGKDQKVFNPNFMASCPWVTAVGATQLNKGASVHDAHPESVANNASDAVPFFSGGGFSNYFGVPSYQKDTVSRYFQEHPSPYPTYQYDGTVQSIGAKGGRFNKNGRGFPDVSTLGSNIYTVTGGCFGKEGGTSYSAPIFAGMVSRINAERENAGKKSLGFINPALYANPNVFNDIETGHNVGCGTQGFAAVKGWDPVTGLGTPKFPELLSYFMSLP